SAVSEPRPLDSETQARPRRWDAGSPGGPPPSGDIASPLRFTDRITDGKRTGPCAVSWLNEASNPTANFAPRGPCCPEEQRAAFGQDSRRYEWRNYAPERPTPRGFPGIAVGAIIPPHFPPGRPPSMKLVRYSVNGQSPRLGVLQGDRIADLQSSLAASLSRRGIVRATELAAALVP